ncbi:hypothetical protein [Brumimicrobium oceani]|uniref:Outer membrane protein beta-barrel domain-containing protein n=1 Tax=Brumimicrobium oceani TaxID=2100725 RepID=A0A2U2XA27_9FLAO|nr:hypothetical protein [Brumimicrobium oceani]PWH84646.1 hypothetical protein DIT68_13045 [Brumimicrobium oceani]
MKKKIIFILILMSVVFQPAIAQRKSKLNTNGQGTLFAQVGYNRSAYSNSDVSLNGNFYDVVLNNTVIQDNAEGKGMGSFLSSSSPQINIKLGYFIQPKWAITLGFDRYNTFFEDNQSVGLEGTFTPEAHSNYIGAVDDEILLTRDQFSIAQSRGINFLSIGVQRNDQHFKSRKAEFAFHTLYGIQAGPLLTQVDYTYDGYVSPSVSSLSGIGVAANIGIRLQFMQYIYLQLELDGGLLNQNNIKLSSNGDTTGKQVVGFISPSVHLGFNILAGSKDKCGTCPQW